MPRGRKRKTKQPPRIALPASDLQERMMDLLRGHKSCSKLKAVGFVYVGSFGREPNWFARPIPSRVADACMKEFVTALAMVRKEFDLMPDCQESADLIGLLTRIKAA